MIVVNLFVFFVFSIAIIVIYLRICYPFWSVQPLLHTYDFWRKLRTTTFPVYPNNPVKTKYTDFENIQTMPYLECSQQDKINLLNLIQCYNISTERINLTVTNTDMDAYLTGSREPSFVSFYNEIVYDCSNILVGDITSVKNPIGTITSRSVRLYTKSVATAATSTTPYDGFPLYFIDYLSTHRERDTKRLCRNLMQTHEYNQRIKNPNVISSLFKREITLLDEVIPLVRYTTTTYNLRNNRFPVLPPHHEIIRINKENIDLLIDFINIHTKTEEYMFDICIFPEITTLLGLIQHNLLYVYCLRRGEDIYGYYFIKDAKIEYEDLAILGGDAAAAKTLHCISSFKNTNDDRFFYLGFLHVIHDIVRLNRDYKMLILDEIGHNVKLFSQWRKKYTPIFTSKSAYYLYNLIYPYSPVSQERVMILL